MNCNFNKNTKSNILKLFLVTFLISVFNSNVSASEITYTPKKTEFRGVWIATVGNIDWPSKKNLTVEQQKEEFIVLLDNAKRMNLNAVVVQIRPTADTFYKSDLNPWSEYLTGVQGKNPGYDPLAFMIEEAHKRNLEFHGWFNPFRVSNNTTKKTWAENSVVNTHPEWIIDYGDKKYINPGIPEARSFIIDSILEVVKNYDIDAVHFDDYFYPYPTSKPFPDEKTFAKYKNNFTNVSDWRRNNINDFIKNVYESIKKEKDYVKLGISPFGVWQNKSQNDSGSQTTASVTSYYSLYADTRLWVKNNWMDYIAPQIYWDFNNKAASYNKTLHFWVKEVHDTNVKLFVGHASYKVGSDNTAWKNPDELPKQLRYNQFFSEVEGSIFYNMTSIINNKLGFKDNISKNYYKYPALIPPTFTNKKISPKEVIVNSAKKTDTSVEIEIDSSSKNFSYYVIYKNLGKTPPNITQPSNIYKIIRSEGLPNQKINDYDIDTSKSYTYSITGLDRYNIESEPSRTINAF